MHGDSYGPAFFFLQIGNICLAKANFFGEVNGFRPRDRRIRRANSTASAAAPDGHGSWAQDYETPA
jgi:hypothetical protein